MIDIPHIYEPDNALPLMVACVFFFLYTILALIDTNTIIKDMGIADEIVSRGKFFYSYISGYLTYFFKITVTLLKLWLLVSLIRAAILILFNLLRPFGVGASANAAEAQFKSSMYQLIQGSLNNNVLWILGIYKMDLSFRTFLVFAPVLLFSVLIGYSILIYDTKKLKEMEEEGEGDEVLQVLNTYHNHTYFLLVLLVILCIVNVMALYIKTFSVYHPPEGWDYIKPAE